MKRKRKNQSQSNQTRFRSILLKMRKEELLNIFGLTQHLIQNKENMSIYKTCINDIKTKGYSVSEAGNPDLISDEPYPIREAMYPFYFDVSSWNRRDRSDIRVIGVREYQRDWVTTLGYRPSITVFMNTSLISCHQWDFSGSPFEPDTGTGVMMVKVYFKEKTPEIGKVFTFINSSGDLDQGVINDSSILTASNKEQGQGQGQTKVFHSIQWIVHPKFIV